MTCQIIVSYMDVAGIFFLWQICENACRSFGNFANIKEDLDHNSPPPCKKSCRSAETTAKFSMIWKKFLGFTINAERDPFSYDENYIWPTAPFHPIEIWALIWAAKPANDALIDVFDVIWWNIQHSLCSFLVLCICLRKWSVK